MATKRINLALQGGGAHGAFTWGALDRLLDEPGIEIAGLSGTSAGALNGAAVKAGLVQGSRAAAQDNLHWFWEQVGAITDPALAPWLGAAAPAAISAAIEASLPFAIGDGIGRMISPYATGPFYANPLERIVTRFHYDKVCAGDGPMLAICATNVRSGKIRVFQGAEITPLSLMASACLPTLFRAVEIEDPATGRTEAYWDGGYTGNPALFPLFAPDLPADIVVVNINPLWRDELPTSARAIQNRINEISFNASLLRELRAIAFVQRLIDEGRMDEGRMKRVLVHMISDDDLMRKLSVATKMVPVPAVLHQLYEAGRSAAETFLAKHIDAIGKTGSVDMAEMFG
ncbi:patatin-like phospholipase family protein [Roseicyclus marinus]|uniref:patatin-like phospholipase family protein n=1 Tax=Roseicyclus marinus TaxID=2161673 RepID=UPI00240FEEEE|nr:patatin-like phospholipase family protein [Roseicyclus marinus]MDG3039925.1 patatin-like phospholipase family protein [Roseicyclus marinus]